MCGRFSLSASRYDVERQFHVDEVAPALVAEEPGARYNIAPTQPVLAVATSRDGSRRRLGTFRWGLVPSWADDASVANRMINARVETAATKPAYRKAFASRRCLIPADGYYEWQVLEGEEGGGKKKRRVPYFFHRRDGLLLAIGGLWEVWHGPDDELLRTCTILTTDANELGATVHDRMPVLVPETLWDRWLAREPLADAELAKATAPAPEGLLVADRVSDLVNSPRRDGPKLVEPTGAGEP